MCRCKSTGAYTTREGLCTREKCKAFSLSSPIFHIIFYIARHVLYFLHPPWRCFSLVPLNSFFFPALRCHNSHSRIPNLPSRPFHILLAFFFSFNYVYLTVLFPSLSLSFLLAFYDCFYHRVRDYAREIIRILSRNCVLDLLVDRGWSRKVAFKIFMILSWWIRSFWNMFRCIEWFRMKLNETLLSEELYKKLWLLYTNQSAWKGEKSDLSKSVVNF